MLLLTFVLKLPHVWKQNLVASLEVSNAFDTFLGQVFMVHVSFLVDASSVLSHHPLREGVYAAEQFFVNVRAIP